MTKEQIEKLLLSNPELVKKYREKPTQLFQDVNLLLKAQEKKPDMWERILKGQPVVLDSLGEKSGAIPLMQLIIKRPELIAKFFPTQVVAEVRGNEPAQHLHTPFSMTPKLKPPGAVN